MSSQVRPVLDDMRRDQALRLVYEVIDAVNPQLPAVRRLTKSPDTVIVGPAGALDSLGVITFVVTLEERVADAIGAPVQLLDDTAFIDDKGALATVDSLATFLERVSAA
jgi:hypothetical protein